MSVDLTKILPNYGTGSTNSRRLTKEQATKLKDLSIKIFECEDCQFYTLTLDSIKQHRKTKYHLNKTPYTKGKVECDICNIKLFGNASLKNHKKTAHNVIITLQSLNKSCKESCKDLKKTETI